MIDRKVIIAWGVHGLTASGVLVAALALLAISRGNATVALAWLLLAVVIDGVDGPLARKFSVSEVLPSIDGALLDLIIDYLTYVFVPVAFLYRFAMLPVGWEVGACALILISSLYLFCNRNMKAHDLYFVGFPSVWNGVVIYAFVLGTSPMLNLIVVVILSVLTFVPIKVVHPFRVRTNRALSASLAMVWMVLTAWIFAVFPDQPLSLEIAWVAAAAYFLGVSIWRTVCGPSS